MSYDNFIKETTTTPGDGDITLANVADHGAFGDIFSDGDPVQYALKDGDNREAGTGTYRAGGILERTSVDATLVGGVYTSGSSITAITLSGGEVEVYNAVTSKLLKSYANTGGGPPFTFLTFSENLSRVGATLIGSPAEIETQVNLGNGASITGVAGNSWQTIGGGFDNQALGSYTTVGGGLTNQAIGLYTTVGGGILNTAATVFATAGGGQNNYSGSQWCVVAGGGNNTANGTGAAIGGGTRNVTNGSRATIIGGDNNHADGTYSVVGGGQGNRAAHTRSLAVGGGGETRGDYDVVIGGVATITPDVANNRIRFAGLTGDILIDGTLASPEADVAEMFEWADGNPNNEDRVGLAVSLKDGKIVVGTTAGSTIGVISATPAVLGNAAPNHWHGMLKRDIYKRLIWETVTVYEFEDDLRVRRGGDVIHEVVVCGSGQPLREAPSAGCKQGVVVAPADMPDVRNAMRTARVTKRKRPQLNPDFDGSREYIPRIDRPEWGVVGMFGQIIVRTATPIAGGMVRFGSDGLAVQGGTYHVIRQLSSTVIVVLYK